MLVVKIKRMDSQALVVFEGIYSTVLPEEAFSHEDVDVVIRGEVQETCTTKNVT